MILVGLCAQILFLVFHDFSFRYFGDMDATKLYRTVVFGDFIIYVNNYFLFFIVKFFYVITGSQANNYWIILGLVNTLFVDVGFFFMYLTCKTLFGQKAALVSLVFVFIIIGFNTLIAYPYSDTISMPFVTSSLYYLIRAVRSQKKVLWSILAGITLAIGWLVKPFIVTIIVAIFIVLGLAFTKHKSYALRVCGLLLSSMFCFFLVIGGFNIFLQKQRITQYDKSYVFPYSYTLAQNIEYNFNEEVHTWLFEYDTVDEKCKAYVKSRLKEMGFAGYMHEVNLKIKSLLRNEAAFNIHNWFIYDNESPNIETRSWYINIFAVTWSVILLGMFISMFTVKKSSGKVDLNLFIKLLPIGIFLILLFFTECWPRYMVGHIPIFCMLAAKGYVTLADKIKEYIDMKKTPVVSLQHGKYKECKKENPCDGEKDRC